MIGAAQTSAADGHRLDMPETFQEVVENMMPETEDTPSEFQEGERFPYQLKVYVFYNDDYIQIFVAILIFVNFAMECVQRQIDPDETQYQGLWDVLEYFFTAAFTIELLGNIYGSWTLKFPKFLRSAWNYFDMLVVAVGILLLIVPDLPGLYFVKMLRAFRVFRLFGRIASLKKIIVSIKKAIPGVLNAFIIMCLVVCIYAVLAVDLYGQYYTTVYGNSSGAGKTPRGEIYGEEYYGNFLRSLYTLFQILTGESWSEMGVRPVLSYTESESKDDLEENILSGLFFISFVIINGIILLNVVVAVLLDGMSAASEEQKQDAELEKTKVENGAANSKKQDVSAQDMDLKQEVSNAKAQVIEMRKKLQEALALVHKDNGRSI